MMLGAATQEIARNMQLVPVRGLARAPAGKGAVFASRLRRDENVLRSPLIEGLCGI